MVTPHIMLISVGSPWLRSTEVLAFGDRVVGPQGAGEQHGRDGEREQMAHV
jgi:hypothetical protein